VTTVMKWPALAGMRPEALEFRPARAAYGKADRATSDFRWLARTDGWSPHQRCVERLLSLGVEDIAMYCPFWRIELSQVYAGACQPSRTIDADARRTPIEKHVLFRSLADFGGPAVPAFAMLEAASGLDDRDWFDTYTDTRWEERSYSVILRPEASPLVRVDPGELPRLIDAAIGDLRQATTLPALARFYASLAAGMRPAILRLSREQALSARALAALLLPLTKSQISLAGGVPSTRIELEQLAANWDGVCVHENARGIGEAVDVSAAHMATGEGLAAALWDNEPGRLTQTAPSSVRVHQTRPAIEDTHAGTEASGRQEETFLTFLDGAERSIDFPLGHAEQLVPIASHQTRLTLAHRFVEQMVRDTLEPLQQRVASASGSLERTFYDARLRHLRLKADVCRAWLLAIAPSEDVVKIAGMPENRNITPLAVAIRVHPVLWRRARDLSPERCAALVDASLERLDDAGEREALRAWAFEAMAWGNQWSQ
jgi:hypothetical protein